MAQESYELESGVDNYLLEDGSGQLLIDQRVEVVGNDTVGVTEANNKSWLKVILENFGVSDVSNIATGFVKLASSTVGLTESRNELRTQWDYLLEDGSGFGYRLEDDSGIYIQDYPIKVAGTETLGITESSQKNLGFLKNVADTVGLTDLGALTLTGFVKVATQFLVAVEEANNYLKELINFYELEDGSGLLILEDGTGGRYELDQLEIVKIITTTLGLTEASQKLLGPIKQIADIVGLTEASNRARIMFRNTTQETVGITEAKNRLGTWIRNIGETVGLTEAQNRLGTIKRNISDTLGLTESNNFIRGLRKTLNDTVGLTEVLNTVTGIVYVIDETIGLTDAVNRLRSVFISVNLGNFVATAAINLSNFYALAGYDLESMTATDSYNAGNFTITDDN